MSKFTIGSTYFFSCYEDFRSKDVDELELIDTNDFKQSRQLTGKGKCLFQLKRHASKEHYIEWALKSKAGMVVGKFLIPEFCKEIGFSINDLYRLKPLIDKLDDKHKYEKIIFDSYLDNNAFVLTEEQRLKAYTSYKESRGIL